MPVAKLLSLSSKSTLFSALWFEGGILHFSFASWLPSRLCSRGWERETSGQEEYEETASLVLCVVFCQLLSSDRLPPPAYVSTPGSNCITPSVSSWQQRDSTRAFWELLRSDDTCVPLASKAVRGSVSWSYYLCPTQDSFLVLPGT